MAKDVLKTLGFSALTILLPLGISRTAWADPAGDALTHFLDEYAAPVDSSVPGEDAGRLARVQSGLSLTAEGFETFRSSPDEKSFALAAEKTDPALRPFFKDRDAALNAIYRTLAVIDYTWAYRSPQPACSPHEKRQALLRSPDGLFADPQTAAVSPWLSRLLGPVAAGKTAEEALKKASSAAKLTERDYARLRARVHGLSAQLADEKTDGPERTRLYCERAEAYASLAAAHVGAALTQAGRATSVDPAGSILLLATREGETLSVVGAAVVVAGAKGPVALTDARLALDAATGKPKPGLLLLSRRGRALSAPVAFAPERWDAELGVVAGAAPEGSPALEMSDKIPARNDLVRGYGPLDLAGLWTETQGLVTRSGPDGFQTDAAAGSLMAGGTVVDEEGRFSGLLVLRQATTAEGTTREWPRALSAPLLSRWLSGEPTEASFAPLQLTGLGTGAIIGARAIEAGYNTVDCYGSTYHDSSLGTIRTTCVANCGCSSSSSSSGSSYGSSGRAGAEMGAALGQALAPIVTEGVKLLFQGLGSLFKSRPRAHVAQAPAATLEPTPVPIPVAPPKPAPPRPKPKCELKSLPAPMVVGMDPFELSVEFKCDDSSASLAKHKVSFTFEWDGKKSTETATVLTDENGRATLSLQIFKEMTVAERVESFAAGSHRDLDAHDSDKKTLGDLSETEDEVSSSEAPLSVGRDVGRAGALTASLALVGRGAAFRTTATIALGPVASSVLIVAAAKTVFDIGWDIGSVAERGMSDIQRGLRQYEKDEDECGKASRYQLEKAGIDDEHEFKDGHGATPNSRFDICACKDGSIIIKANRMCGKRGPSIGTDKRWK